MRRNKIPLKKVQIAFSNAIKRRDGFCQVRDFEPCCGGLECSHFYTQGSTPSLMFYPANAYAQCSKHHWNHHNKGDPFYLNWIAREHYCSYEKMERLRHRYIKYTDELKAKIIELCNEDRLNELTVLIDKELGE